MKREESVEEPVIHEIEAKSILRKHRRIDSWFLSRYGMNLYRGCEHNCVYCDGRHEKYSVEGRFGREVTVKVNAIDLLKKELDPERKRKPFSKGYILLGGGVGDSYQPIENRYRLARQALELLRLFHHSVHLLTKSTALLNDLDLLKTIHEESSLIVSFSFSSVDDRISSLFEPGVPPPGDRLKTIARLKSEGLSCGMYLMPVIPLITDSPGMIEESVIKGKEAGVDFIVFGAMTLKEGRQKDYFYTILREYYPDKVDEYDLLYAPPNPWGEAAGEYYSSLNQLFLNIAKKHRVPSRIPIHLYRQLLDETSLVIVILEHLDYLLKSQNRISPYGYAAYSLSKFNKPLNDIRGELFRIKGVGQKTQRIIREILETKNCSLLDELMYL